MGFKDEFKKEMANSMYDLNIGLSKSWTILHEGHKITLENSMHQERLYINDKLVDENIHQSILAHLKPISRLTGTITLPNGQTKKVKVTLGGLVKLVIKVRVDGKTIFKEKMKVEAAAPWEGKTRITPFITHQVEKHGLVMETALPDHAFCLAVDVGDMEPGERDQLLYEGYTSFYIKKLTNLLHAQVETQTDSTRKLTYHKICEEHVRMYGAEILYHLQETSLNQEKLREEMLWLLEFATHREVVKFALLVLSTCAREKDELLMYQLAHHEEFTMYACSALAQERLWDLANKLIGWGKVAVMNHLDAFSLEKKKWFLAQAFPDEIKRKAVAVLRAEQCELDIWLHEKNLSDEEWNKITGLLNDLLLKEEDAFDYLIDEYSAGGPALVKYVGLMKKKEITNEEIELLQKIEGFVTEKLSYVDLEDENVNQPGYVDAEYLISDLEKVQDDVIELLKR